MPLATKLSAEEFYTLVGLAFLARERDKTMIAIVRGIAKITGEDLDQNDYGHAADLVYGPEGDNAVQDVRIMLHKLHIVHEEEIPDEVQEAPKV